MKKLLSLMMYAFLSFSLVACGGGGGGGGGGTPKPTVLPSGYSMVYDFYADSDGFGNDFIIFEPWIFDSDDIDQDDYDTSAAIWTVEPASAGDFVDTAYVSPTPMYKGSKQFNFSGSTNKVKISIELEGVKFTASLKLSDILGYDPTKTSGGDYEFQSVRVDCNSNVNSNYYLYTGEGTSLKCSEVVNMKARIRTTYGDFVDNLPTTWSLSRTDIVSLSSNSGSNVILTCNNNSEDTDSGYFWTTVILTVTCDGHTQNFPLKIDSSVYRPYP